MKKIIILCLLLVVTCNVFAVPSITKYVSSATAFKFTVTLGRSLPKGYRVKIDLNNGKGFVPMNCSGTNCTLLSNTLPKDVNSSIYKVGIYDVKGLLQGETIDGYYVITSANTVTKTFSYTKISNLGATLPDTAMLPDIGRLGFRLNDENDWVCTKDNKTGLVWQVETTGNSYTNYFTGDPDYGSRDNVDIFINSVNEKGLCGATNWRLPTVDELMKLVYCSNGKYETDGSCTHIEQYDVPTINTTYFPNTNFIYMYWSSSSSDTSSMNIAYSASSAKGVFFRYGDSENGYKSMKNLVRLVH